MSTQLNLFENKKHNCRNCTACIYETKCTDGNMVNRVYCIHGIVDVVIGSDTNYFTDCERYAELFCANILGIPLTESEA